MRRYLALAFTVAISGCANSGAYTVFVLDPEGLKAAIADSKECESRGFQQGTNAYDDCRLKLIAQHNAAGLPPY